MRSYLLPILLLVSATWDGGGYSEARCELTVVQPVYWYCGRQTWRDADGKIHVSSDCFRGKKQRVLVRIGGTDVTMDGTNLAPGLIELNGETVRFDEQGRVR